MNEQKRNYWEKFADTRLILNERVENLDFMRAEALKGVQAMDLQWSRQNNKQDFNSEFIYSTDSFDEILRIIHALNINDKKAINYILHRWVNRMASSACENLFNAYNIVKKEPNAKKSGTDFFICGVPFDLKVTTFPKALLDSLPISEAKTRKNEIIQWLYNNQSRGKRFHTGNRLFLMSLSNDPKRLDEMKFNFNAIAPLIEAYLEDTLKRINLKKEPFNTVHLHLKNTPETKTSPGGTFEGEVFSDILFID